MRGMHLVWLATALFAGAVGVSACGSHEAGGGPVGALETYGSADTIDVSPGSQMSLALHGGLGPLLSGQNIDKTSVTLSDFQLIDGSGNSVVLSSDSFTGDLVALQDQLGQIFSQHAIQPGSYTALRFRLRSAWIEAQDAQGGARVYASQGVDTSQFSQGESVQTLQLSGLDSEGFVTCALPQGGIAIAGTSSLALQFALAQSLQVQSGEAWVLTPQCWLVDASTFSSLDVDFEMSSSVSSSEQYWSNGFQVMLLDSNLYPVAAVPLAVYQSATFRAHFLYLQAFQGPFVAALLPPSGYSLQSTVAFSVDVQQSVSVSASVSVTSFQVVSARSFAIGTADQCQVVQHDRRGRVLAQTNAPIGAVEDVAPTTHHREPGRSGEQPPTPASPPQLPGNPPPRPRHAHGGPEGTPSTTATVPEMPPAPAPTATEHAKTPSLPAPTEHRMMPSAPTPSEEHGMIPPAPTPPEHGNMRWSPPPAVSQPPPPMPPASTGGRNPSTDRGSGGGRPQTPAAPVTTGASSPPTAGGGRAHVDGSSTPARSTPPTRGRSRSMLRKPSQGGPYPSFGAAHGPAGHRPQSTDSTPPRGRGIDTRIH